MGDRAKAREEVETALAIDPEFLAARMLRDELDAPPPSPAVPRPSSAEPASLAASRAKVAALEARVKARVQSREKDVLSQQRIVVAPPRSRPVPAYRLGAAVVGIAAFLAAMSGSQVRAPRTLLSRSSVSMATLIDAASPAPLVNDPAPALPRDEPPRVEEQLYTRPLVRPAAVPVSVPIQAAPQLVIPPPVQALPTPAAAVTDSPPPAFVPRPVDDRALVEDLLSRYRRAYNRLDAQSAQAIYPAVNAPALARAFDGLESQSLQFDECDIDVRGGSASVSCRGTSRYVPKIGSREPHVEPRTWDFTLRKDQGDWKIENARAGR